MTYSESKVTYLQQYKTICFDKYRFKISNLYMVQLKEKYGIRERENYNKPKNGDLKQLIFPKEKEEAIKDVFRYFQTI